MSEKREFAGWWLWVTLLIIISAIGFGALRYAGLVGGTIIERKVFEQSYQRQAGDAAKLATFQAQEASISAQLRRGDLTAGARADYNAQLSAIRIQISTIEVQQ